MTKYEKALERVQWLEKQAQGVDITQEARKEYQTSARRERTALERMSVAEASILTSEVPF